MGTPLVQVIITTYNGRDLIRDCLNSMKVLSYPNHAVLVMDDASTDGTVEMIQEQFPGVRVESNARNLGYIGNVNRGVRMSLDSDYILILNNDITVSNSLVSELVSVAESDPRIAVCGPKMFYASPPDRIWAAGGRLSSFTGRAWMNSYGLRQDSVRENRDVAWIPGAAILIRTNAFRDLGLFDPVYRNYDEEVEFCQKATASGWRVVYVPTCYVHHGVGKTMGGRNRAGQKFFLARNRVWRVRRTVSRGRWMLMMVFDLMQTGAEFFYEFFAEGGAVACSMFRGYLAGLTGEPHQA